LFALPVLSLSKELEKYSAILPKAVLVTDCLSVKKDFKKTLDERNLDTSNFVLSHPIAGSEKSGFKNSTPDLFKNRISVLTRLADTSESAFQICSELWSEVGSSSIELSIEEHDKFFALTSHLPHLIAFSLISAVSEINPGSANLLSGGGLKDFTRIASSDPKMWEDIFLSNKENILKSLESFKKEINNIESHIKSSDAKKINEIIKSAKLYRDSLL
jgi:prephenate dehydrogenase